AVSAVRLSKPARGRSRRFAPHVRSARAIFPARYRGQEERPPSLAGERDPRREAMSRPARVLAVSAGIAFGAALVAYYIVSYLMVTPPPVAAAQQPAGASLTLQTVASLGFKPHPDWDSYLAKNPQGKWVHSTILKVPANSLVKVTVYQYDTATGLRNPYWGGPRGIVGEMSVNGRPTPTLDPDLASHTFAIPELGVSVPLQGVPDDAKHQ